MAETDDDAARRLLSVIDHDAPPVWIVNRVLREMRTELDLEVSFIAEVVGGRRLFRFVDGEADSFGISVDTGDPLDETLCDQVMRTCSPRVVASVADDPEARNLQVVSDRDIAAYLGVPVVTGDGGVYGTLCVLSHQQRPWLDEQHAAFVRVAATLIGEQLDRDELAKLPRRQTRDRIDRLLAGDGQAGLDIVFQPIVDLAAGQLLGFEALARFPTPAERTPDRWFTDAWTVGVGCELELAAARIALEALPRIEKPAYLAINLSPDAILDHRTLELLEGHPGDRVVLELTEHAPIRDHAPLRERLADLCDRDFRIALDDIGTGYGTLNLLVELQPTIHKLDVSVVRGIASDRSRQALVAGLARFADTMGALTIAEGVESAEEQQLLRELGVHAAQGYHFARPGPAPTVAAGSLRS